MVRWEVRVPPLLGCWSWRGLGVASAWFALRADMVIVGCKVRGFVQGVRTLYSYDGLGISVELWDGSGRSDTRDRGWRWPGDDPRSRE